MQREKKELTLLGCAIFFFFGTRPLLPSSSPKALGSQSLLEGCSLGARLSVKKHKTYCKKEKKGEKQHIQCPKLTRNSNGGAMSKSSWLRPLY